MAVFDNANNSEDERAAGLGPLQRTVVTDTTPPTVSLTAPNSGTFSVGSQVTLSATANDASGISYCGYYLYKGGNTLIDIIYQGNPGDGMVSPYFWTVPATVNGYTINGTDYQIVVAAWDASPNRNGNTAESSGYLTLAPPVTTYTGTENHTGGAISLSNNGPYTYGQVITVTASPLVGYVFSGWSVTGASRLGNSTTVATTLTIYDNFTLTASFTVRPLGDINGDGVVDANDLAILNARLNGFSIAPCADADCDLNHDGHVTTADRVRLRKILNGVASP
jgi:uncharacterized repeat protein (TIGR02543 family)